MSDVRSALGFLVWRSLVNRVLQQARRLRQPRYAIGMVLVLLYFGLIFVVPLITKDAAPRPTPAVPRDGTLALAISSLALFLVTASGWLFKGRGRVLAFQPAEVGLLFPAPLSRRALLLYRLGQLQAVILLNALILAFVSARSVDSIPFWQRMLGGWLFVMVLMLHQMGVALLRVEPVLPARRLALRLGRVIAVLAIGVVGLTLVQTIPAVTGLPFADTVRVLRGALSEGLAGLIMAPFTWVMAPTSASGSALFSAAIGSLAVIGALLLWVLRGTVPFEEVAATASAEQASALQRLRDVQRGRGSLIAPTAQAATRSLPLAPTGAPWRALVWKNTMAMLRTRMYLSLLVMVGGALLLTGMVSRMSGSRPGVEAVVPMVLVTSTLMLTLVGMSALRNDLRTDMEMLALLKTWPLPGQAMMLGQILSPALTIALAQGLVLVIGMLLFGGQAGFASGATLLVAGATVLAFCILLNLLALTIQSGAALLFPGWIHLGVHATGVETIGQRLLMGIGTGIAIAFLLLVPGALGGATIWVANVGLAVAPVIAMLLGGIVGLLLLALEVALLVGWLGERFDLTDAAAVL